MGYLAAGALSAVGKEWTKQSGEERQNKYQEMRDRRLAELTTTENIRAEGVAATQADLDRQFQSKESKADREARAKVSEAEQKAATERAKLQNRYQNVGAGSALVDTETGKVVRDQPKTFADSAKANLEAQKTLYRMNADGSKGAATDWAEIQEQYLNDPDIFTDETITDPIFGPQKRKVRKPGSPGITEYANRQLWEGSRMRTDDINEINLDPDRMWEFAKKQPQFREPGGPERAIESIKKLHGKYWQGPQETGDPLDNPTTPSPNPNEPNPSAGMGSGGYLGLATEAQQKAAAAAATTAPAATEGQMLESSRDIQGQIDQIKGMITQSSGPRGDPARIPALQQMLQQYEQLLQKALEQESKVQARGPASVAGQPPTMQNFMNQQLAQR